MNRLAFAPALLAATALLSGCATLGGTVKGDFACRAPTGTCAPMTAIDAAAIRSLAGNGVGTEAEGRTRQPSLTPRSGAVPIRTGERMLTILLPAHVDEVGVLHDAATVHAVVEEAGWTFAAGGDPLANPEFSRSSAPSSLREAVAGASAPAIEGLETLPARAPHPLTPTGAVSAAADDGPSAAAIAAARAGHRIAPSSVSTPDLSQGEAAPLSAATPLALPSGKVVLPQGDAAAARARLKALIGPRLPQLGQSSFATDRDPGDLDDPFARLPGRELPR
ncbi:TraV family lipoprotein [Sphingomonas solaris]|uniref:TraV family lipoprotein n=1 Tax=Alterirhizorhabdus solaris TaxID=2529389 RepID=A0A558R5M4_9SPHN|nr:TraV family lipoprotein [Sphingomonas solaris]TVV74622.1 TraV family lipoprotein [Sphingomonas solaris]